MVSSVLASCEYQPCKVLSPSLSVSLSYTGITNIVVSFRVRRLTFGSCYSVCIISVYRMFTLRTAVYSNDPPWENIGAAIWSTIELNTSIICASLPTIRPLLSKWLPGAGLSSAHNKTSAYNRYGSSSGMGRGTFKELKSGQREVSTEELVLNDMNANQSGSLPSVYAHVTADPEMGHRDLRNKGSHQNQIMVTTETMIKEGRQPGISRKG